MTESLFENVLAFFEGEDWPVTRFDAGAGVRTSVECRNGTWGCIAYVREERRQFSFYSLCAVTAPPDRRTAAALYLTRANCGLVVGNFELDDGGDDDDDK